MSYVPWIIQKYWCSFDVEKHPSLLLSARQGPSVKLFSKRDCYETGSKLLTGRRGNGSGRKSDQLASFWPQDVKASSGGEFEESSGRLVTQLGDGRVQWSTGGLVGSGSMWNVGRSVRRTHQQVTWARSLLQPMCSNSDSIAWHLKTFVTFVYSHLSAQNIWPDQPGWIFPDAGGRIKDGQSSASASARRVSPPEQWAAGQFVVGWAPSSSAQWATR